MQKYDPRLCLPSSEELPDSDETPVDNELQDLMPGLLKQILAQIWHDRWDWFFGVDMGIYYDPELPAVVPDGFLSLGVERFFDEELRLSYVMWEEKNISPCFVLEVVSRKYRGEYSRKKAFYAELGVLYYAVYSSKRRRKPPLEVYHLINGEYVLLSGDPIWMPEIGLGIGRARGAYQGIEREWLYWFNEQGERYPTPEERAEQAEQRASQAQLQAEQAQLQAEQAQLQAEQAQLRSSELEQLIALERQRAERLAAQLRALNIDPDAL
jgi:Uma2 family endonuclease